MLNRREEIELELRQLRRLESQLSDKHKTREGIKAVIADLEAEKAALPTDEK